jgi:hypothetical protein
MTVRRSIRARTSGNRYLTQVNHVELMGYDDSSMQPGCKRHLQQSRKRYRRALEAGQQLGDGVNDEVDGYAAEPALLQPGASRAHGAGNVARVLTKQAY